MFGKRDQDNKFNKFIRERIRQAREESGKTQAELGKIVYKSAVAISDIERGRTQVSAVDLMLIGPALDKPITFFFPNWSIVRGAQVDELTDKEKELILWFRKIWDSSVEDIALSQVKRLAEIAIETQLKEQERQAAEERSKPKDPDAEAAEAKERAEIKASLKEHSGPKPPWKTKGAKPPWKDEKAKK